MSLPQFILTAEAQRDVDAIGAYTLEYWGSDDVIGYLSRIDDRFSVICLDQSQDRDVGAIRPGLLSVQTGSHVIFFHRRGDGDIVVLRVQHQCMDFRRHL